jgi:hypothetical protein
MDTLKSAASVLLALACAAGCGGVQQGGAVDPTDEYVASCGDEGSAGFPDCAIAELEKALKLHRLNPKRAPAILLRLARLHYERSEAAHAALMNDWRTDFPSKREAGPPPDEPERPDHSKTIEYAERIVEKFDSSPERSAALFYLVRAHDSRKQKGARIRAALSLVCPSASDPFEVDYADCSPLAAEPTHVAEAWVAVAEHLRTLIDPPDGTDVRIRAAYQRSLEAGKGWERYVEIVDTLAHRSFRDGDYPGALGLWIEVLTLMVESPEPGSRSWLDRFEVAAQQAARCLRSHDSLKKFHDEPDRGFELLRSAEIVAQDAPFLDELYYQLGRSYQRSRPPLHEQALPVLEAFLERDEWERSLRRPAVIVLLTGLYDRSGRHAEMYDLLGELNRLTIDSSWAEANAGDPIRLGQALLTVAEFAVQVEGLPTNAERYEAVYDAYCKTDVVALKAWEALIELAEKNRDDAELTRLVHLQRERECWPARVPLSWIWHTAAENHKRIQAVIDRYSED